MENWGGLMYLSLFFVFLKKKYLKKKKKKKKKLCFELKSYALQ